MYKKAYHTIFFVMPVHSLTSIKEDENILLDLPDDQLYNDLDYDTLSEIYSRILHLSSEGYDSLIIIDDMMSALKTHNCWNCLTKLYAIEGIINVQFGVLLRYIML